MKMFDLLYDKTSQYLNKFNQSTLKKWIVRISIIIGATLFLMLSVKVYYHYSALYYKNKVFKRIARGELDCSNAMFFLQQNQKGN